MLRAAAALLAVASFCAAAPAANAPQIDKDKFAAYVRYAEGFTDAVAIAVDDPQPSSIPGYYRLTVRLTAGKSNLGGKIYYVSADGQRFFSGSIWDLNQSPFSDTISELPAGLPSFGSTNPRVVIVVFSDFECPFCRQLAQALRTNIPKLHPNDVQVQFADFPLQSKHLWALAAAEAGHCVGDKNTAAFWRFHDWIYAHQNDITPDGANLRDQVLAWAKQDGLDAVQIGACMESHATAKEVQSNQDRAYLLGVSQTPTMFVDGRKVEGAMPWDNLEQLIQYELKRPQNFPVAPK